MDRTFFISNAALWRPEPTQVRASFAPGSVWVRDGVVEAVGALDPPAGVPVVDAGGRLLTPGLVDAHTHLLFAGDRAAEFCARAAGASYLELAKSGGGIAATVKATRTASLDELLGRCLERCERLARFGVTTVEVKTGYGLSYADELAQLELLARVSAGPRLTPTLLAAHAIPPEATTAGLRAAWVDAIATTLIPEVARRKLAPRIDVFVEASAYTHDEARIVCEAARAHGLALHLHVDQLTANGGAELAASLGAQAVAHLERVSEAGIEALARAGTVAVLLPTATLAAREPSCAPARRLIDAGVGVALATNLNPGTAPSESTALTLFLASVSLQLTADESLWAFTRGGALALGMPNLGLLEPGAPADLVLWNAFEPAHLPYHAAVNHVATVWRDGRVIASNEPACDGWL